MGVDPGGTSENDTVAVKQIDRALRLDLAENLARLAGWVDNAIQHDPAIRAIGRRSSALVEIDCRVLTYVERLPVQNRLLRGLGNRDGRLAVRHRLCRFSGAYPCRYRIGH